MRNNDFLYVLDQHTKEIKLLRYLGKDHEVTIPDEMNGYPVTSIDELCFCKNNILDFTYEYTIQSFKVSPNHPVFITHDHALYDKTNQTLIRYPNIQKNNIYLPHHLINIGGHAFDSCTGIKEIYFSENVQYIGNNAFDYCHIKTMRLPKNLEIINNSLISRYTSFKFFEVDQDNPYYTAIDGVLYSKDLVHLIAYPTHKKDATYIIHENVQCIDDYAFARNHYIKEILLLDNVKSIGNKAFFDCCYLESINLVDSIDKIGCYAFYGCHSLKDIVLPKNLQFIEKGLFDDCRQLRCVMMYDKVMYINDDAFSGCHDLESIRLSSLLKRIGDTAFYECLSLKYICIPSSVQYISYNAFKECSEELVIDGYPYFYERFGCYMID
ncbi:MAG: leucine-rich repeat domain-containing protein [Erysipelotrichaceae bacterium]|nr:leucine-rich repeat domain-containing protein [Erysipelotrichaceae bacterium]